MRFPSLLCLFALTTSAVIFSAETAPATGPEAPPELRGVLIAGGVRQFSLVAPGRGTSAWAKVGERFAGWDIVEFKPADETLVLKKDGRRLVLKLADSAVADAPPAAVKATLADAEEVFRKMDFDRMMSRIIDQQKVNMAAMARKMGGPGGSDPEARAALQKKTMDLLFDAMDLPGMKNDMVKVYSEVFSKEELRGLADFYGTASGQALVDKQPEVSQKMNELILPRMMAAMPKIQEMQKQFTAEQAAKRQAATTEAVAPAAATAPKP
jgi:uncharacterized protein